jgi:threonine/homoserine/homoserine lactone efflux protein
VNPQLAAYVALTAVFVATPGAATAIVVRNAIDAGPYAGMTAGGGVLIANLAYAAAAAFGAAAFLQSAPGAYQLVQFGGACYLAWLGVRSLVSARLTNRPPLLASVSADDVESASAGGPLVPRERLTSAFSQGLIANLLNPAVLAFYALVVPSFLRGPSSAGGVATLAGIHVSMAFSCHTAWAWGFHALRRLWMRPAARRTIDIVTGAALLGLAARILMR